MIFIGEIFLKREEVGYLFKMLFGFFFNTRKVFSPG